MRFKIFTLMLSVLILAVQLQSKPAATLQKTQAGYTMDFTLPDYEILDVDTLGQLKKRGYGSQVFSRIRVWDYSETEDVGKPALPFHFFYIAIADPGRLPSFEVLNRVEQTIVPQNRIFPAQLPWYKYQTVKDRFLSINEEYYGTSGTSAPVAEVTEVFRIRGIPIVTIRINPFSYNPAENKLTLLKKFTLRIKTPTSNMHNAIDSKAMQSYLRCLLSNFDYSVQPMRTTARADDYLIVTAPNFESGLSEFINFRKKRFNVTVATTSQTGSGASSIKSYIADKKPTFCLLVGDEDEIPGSPGSNRLTDLYYSTTDGDYRPEILIGRFSVANSTELGNIVRKTIYMEENMGKIDKRNAFLAGEDRTYWQTAERTHNYCIDNYLDEWENIKFYCHNNSISEREFTDALNKGVIYNFYSAHGSQTSWGAGDFSLSGSDMKNLTNETHYAFQYGFCCLSGTYSRSECFTESAIRAKGGSVAAIGATISTTWTPDEKVQKGIFDGIFHSTDPQTTVSASLNYGKASNSSSTKTYYEVYNIMGDPAAEMLPINVGPYLSVLEPSSGSYFVGDKVKVTWETGNGANVTNVKIEYSTNNGTSFTAITASTPNTSSYDWTIPDVPESDECIVQVSEVGGSLVDVSGVFAIKQKAAIALNPASLSARAAVNQTIDKTLKVENKGKGKLTYAIRAAGVKSNLKINELFVSETNFHDGLEIWNQGGDQDMTGWKVEWKDNQNTSGSYTFKDGYVFKAGKTVILMDESDKVNDSTFYVGGNMYWDQGVTELSVAILDKDGKGVDFVRSANNNDSPPTGTAWTGTGVALSSDYIFRKGNDDNDNAADWTGGSSGTPNKLNANQTNSGSGHWLTCAPNEGTVDGLQSVQVKVTFNSAGLTLGSTYRDTLIITHNSADINSPSRIPCEFVVDVNAIVNARSLITSFGINYYNSRLVYQIPEIKGNKKTNVSIKIYNLQGKMIRTLVNEPKGYGMYSVSVSDNLASGLYLVKMEVADFNKTIRIVNK